MSSNNNGTVLRNQTDASQITSLHIFQNFRMSLAMGRLHPLLPAVMADICNILIGGMEMLYN